MVLSKHFFQKRWAQRELNGLVAREIVEVRRVVLPIWHGIDHEEIVQHSPTLADVRAVSSTQGIGAVVQELLKKLQPDESPLITARNFLMSKGIIPPVVTDEWWLDQVEMQEAQLRSPDLNHGRRWIFPLPFPYASRGKERGLNIAWTALQMEWAYDGEEQKLCQLTHPEKIHDFLRRWPGLLDCAIENPGVLATYAPQITIPGFDDGLSEAFETLMPPDCDDAYQSPGYGGSPETTNGGKPLCGELIAWRHPTFGNYAPKELSFSFVDAHDSYYARRSFGSFECLIWLLCDEANWMPHQLRETLIEGMRTGPYGWSNEVFHARNAFSNALLRRSRSKFNFTRSIRAAIRDLIAEALGKLLLAEKADIITEHFIAARFVEAFYDEQDRVREFRKKHS